MAPPLVTAPPPGVEPPPVAAPSLLASPLPPPLPSPGLVYPPPAGWSTADAREPLPPLPPTARPAQTSLLDRRASAALDPPPLERPSTVALSLAGLFDDIATEQAPEPKRDHAPPSFFDEEPEVAPRPKRRRGRSLISPGGIIAAIAIIGALYVVGFFVSRTNPPKPPSQDQVTLTIHR